MASRPGEREDQRQPPPKAPKIIKPQQTRRTVPPVVRREPRGNRPGERDETRRDPKARARATYAVQERMPRPSQGRQKAEDWEVTDNLNRLKDKQQSAVKLRADADAAELRRRLGTVTTQRNISGGRDPIVGKTRPEGLHPPATTGPVVGPPGALRATTAARYQLGDEARRQMAHTPIEWGKTSDDYNAGGMYFPTSGKIWSNQYSPDDAAGGGILAHEMSHKRWYEDLGIGRGNWAQSQEFITDTEAMARAGQRWAQRAVDAWEADVPWYSEYRGYDINQDVPSHGIELHARVAQLTQDGEQIPDWYRNKWYPNVWSDENRSLNRFARFDQEFPSRDPRTPDERGFYG